MIHLEQTLAPNFKMNVKVLEKKPVGDILLATVQEWSKIGGKVTVAEFCDVSKNQLKIGRVEEVLRTAEGKWEESRISSVFSAPRPGDSVEEQV